MSVFVVRVKFSGQVVEDVETYRTRPAAAHAAAGLASSSRDGKLPVSVGIHVTTLLGCANERCVMFKASTGLVVCPVCHRATAHAVYQPRDMTWRRRGARGANAVDPAAAEITRLRQPA
jgi:hypothetical protein